MFSATPLLVLLAAQVLAGPLSNEDRLADRVARRASGSRWSRPVQFIESAESKPSNASNVEYSTNWSGAVLSFPKGSVKSVTGTFAVPTPQKGSGSASSWAASAWVGIDGFTCETAILQTGLDFTVSSAGAVSYDGWYEWYPEYAYDFSGITFSPGDSVTLTVTATTSKSGTAVIQNNSKGKSVTKAITSSTALCQEDAEWIVEDFDEGSSLVPFANFGKVVFTNAYVTLTNGTKVYPPGATLLDIDQGGTIITNASTSPTSVTVSYV